MTDGELGTIATSILGGLTGIGAVIRWGFQRITNVIEKNSETMLKFVESAARLEVKLDHAHAASIASAATMQEVKDELSGVHEAAAPEPRDEWDTPRTPAGGYALHHKRKGTR